MRMRLSFHFPSTTRSMAMPFTATCRPVAGIPMKVPWWVPYQVKRHTTFSPEVICSSVTHWWSGKAGKATVARNSFLGGDLVDGADVLVVKDLLTKSGHDLGW